MRRVFLAFVALISIGVTPVYGQVTLQPGVVPPDLDAVAERLASPPASAEAARTAPARPGPLFDPDVSGSQDVWSRVTLRSGADRDVRWVIPLSVDEATVTVFGGQRPVEVRTGWAVPLAERSVPLAHPPLVAIDLPAGAERTLVIHVRHDASGYATEVAPRPETAEAFYARQSQLNVSRGMFLGLLFALAAYNLFLFGTFRDRSYLAYVGFLIGSMVYWATDPCFLLAYIWPTTWRVYLELSFFGLALAASSYLLFARAFNQTATHAPRLDRVLLGLAALWGLLAVGAVAAWAGLPLWTGVQRVAGLAGFATLVGALAAGVSAWRRSYVPAGYYLLASSAMVATGLAFILAWFGWLQMPWPARVALQIGMGTEALLLAMALSARIRLLNSQRMEAETARREADATAEALRDAIALKSNLLGFAAHDLRTPLIGILGFADLIRLDTPEGTPVRMYGEHIESSANRLLRLIQDLLVTASLDQKPDLDLTRTVDLGALVAETVEPFHLAAQAKRQRIDLRLAPGCHVCIDEDRFREVIDNLVSNALKFSPPDGTLGVEVRGDGRKVWMSVADSGPGFAPEDHDAIFKPFTKLSARPTGGESSTGLGLAIVKQIVDLHGGVIQVESEAGRGARVTVVLDAVAAPEDVPPVDAPPVSDASRAGAARTGSSIVIERPYQP